MYPDNVPSWRTTTPNSLRLNDHYDVINVISNRDPGSDPSVVTQLETSYYNYLNVIKTKSVKIGVGDRLLCY